MFTQSPFNCSLRNTTFWVPSVQIFIFFAIVTVSESSRCQKCLPRLFAFGLAININNKQIMKCSRSVKTAYVPRLLILFIVTITFSNCFKLL